MRYIDFSSPEKVHFTGIGGISMSGFAELLKRKGFTVTGSDSKKSPITEHLEELGIRVDVGQRADNVDEDVKVLVYTAAVKEDNPELVRARELGIPTIERSRMVGDVMLHYSRNFAVAGTHGKTTTTSMLTIICLEAGFDPTVSVGGELDNIGGNMRLGGLDNFVIEACEYTDSFLKFHPTHAIVTNIEPEHLDYFGDIERERESFGRFADLLPADGVLVINSGIDRYEEISGRAACPVITYGLPETGDPEYTAADITYDEMGRGSYTLMHRGKPLGRIGLSVVGEHNISNSIAAAAMALYCGIDFDTIAGALTLYGGTKRRFEKKGVIGGVTIIDDYAHHPTEIAATLAAAARYPHKRLWVVFQPHTYSRTVAFLHEIGEALAVADSVILTDIYAAREVNTSGVHPRDIILSLDEKKGKKFYYISSFEEIEAFLLSECCEGDLLITMGAGDVVKIGERLLGQ